LAAVGAAVVVSAVMAVLAAVLGASVLTVPVHAAPAPRRPPATTPRRPPATEPLRPRVTDPVASARFGPARVLLRGLGTSRVMAYAAGRALWVASSHEQRPGLSLLRLATSSGAIRARASLGAASLGDVLLAEGWLWVTTNSLTGRSPAWLWRLDPNSLSVLSRTQLRSPLSTAALATAGASIWVADGGVLDHVAAIGGAIIGRVRVSGARSMELAGADRGAQLLVSAGDGSGRARIQLRDGATGALLRSSARFLGVSEPKLGGGVGGWLWISQATGMAGYIERLDARTLTPRPGATGPPQATNGIQAQVADRILWVSQPHGGPARNYCANPVTGSPRVILPVAARRGALLSVGASSIYFLGPGLRQLLTAAIPRECR
jgi:hypothetical protein